MFLVYMFLGRKRALNLKNLIMDKTKKDLGVIMALLQRFERYRLPATLKLKEKVDRGETLNKRDMQFLSQVEADAKKIRPILDRNPQYQDLVENATKLFNEVTQKALENEKREKGSVDT